MPTANFTTRWVTAIKASDTIQLDYFDGRTVGFGLRVSRAGRKTWFCMYRHGARLRRLTIGPYPALTLADARERAKAALHEAARGGDPAADKKAERLAETFGELAQAYLEKYAKARKRSWREDARVIQRELLPRWGSRKAKDIKRRDVIALLDTIVERGAPIQANRVLALVRKIFNWGISRDIVENNPCVQVKSPGAEKQRERVLLETELRAIWLAFEQLDPIVGGMFKLRLLTAQRGGEVESMRWLDLDLANGWWTIPASVAKNGRSHRVPLSSPALGILGAMQENARGEVWVFPSPTRTNQHITNVQKAAERVRDLSGVSFVLHDMRRTAASLMTGMGTTRLVVAKVLNHVEVGVTKVYDRHSYDREKHRALDLWSSRLVEIIAGEKGKVINLRG